MSSNRNSVIPRFGTTLKEVAESLGVTQFPDETGWYQVIGGLIIQGGYTEVTSGSTLVVPFYAPHEKQTLGVWLQTAGGSHNAAYVDAVTLEDFEIHSGSGNRHYYWIAIGV